MLPFDVTIPATVPQRSEIPEGLMNYPVLPKLSENYLQAYFQNGRDVWIYVEWRWPHKRVEINTCYVPTGTIQLLNLVLNTLHFCVISSFRREVDENCILLGHYAASSGNSLPTFRDNPWRLDRWVVRKRWWWIITTCCVITQKIAVLVDFWAITWLPDICCLSRF